MNPNLPINQGDVREAPKRKEKYRHVPITTGDPVKTIKILLGFLALLALFAFAPPAIANHPDDDDFDRDTMVPKVPPPPLEGWYDNFCDEDTDGEQIFVDGENVGNPHGQWGSMDGQIWECMPDPGLPGVPATEGWHWEPRPKVPGLAATSYSRRWDPLSIPGYPGAYARLGARSEWVNTYNKPPATSAPPEGSCPNIPGGCKFKGGADLELVKSDGTPLALNRTWINHAMQVYVYNATTKLWEKKHDTGWTMNSATAPTSKMTGTYNYGTAPYGAAWYFVRAQQRIWNGTAWQPARIQDPVNADGSIKSIWDDPPGDTTKKPKKPTKAPQAEKVKRQPSFIEPTPSEPETAAIATPAETP